MYINNPLNVKEDYVDVERDNIIYQLPCISMNAADINNK